MRLRVLLPSEVLVDAKATRIIAEAVNGWFCLLPRHVDFATALVPGLLSFESEGQEHFVAVDEGILVKCGPDVRVSVRAALFGPDLGALRRALEEQFHNVDDRERLARSALARLEASFVRRFIQLGKHEHA